MNAKAGEHRRSEICGLDVTISARYDWSVASFHYVIGISGILPYSRNVTLQQECYLTNIPLEHSRFLPPTQYFQSSLGWLVGNYAIKNIGHHACLIEKEHFFFFKLSLRGNFFHCVHARAHLRTLMTQRTCAVGMRNTILRNHLNFLFQITLEII